MARRKLEDKLIYKDCIKEEIKKIAESDNYYISENGNVYVDYGNNYFYPKKLSLRAGYLYCSIKYQGQMKHKRIHRLVAEAFLTKENEEQIVVGHKNNIKTDNKKDNLYWTTIKENTQKAFDDGLAKNAMGYEDSQSLPVYCLDLEGNIIKDYGSITICAKALNISKSTVARQCNHETKGKPRCGYRFRYQKEYDEKGFVL